MTQQLLNSLILPSSFLIPPPELRASLLSPSLPVVMLSEAETSLIVPVPAEPSAVIDTRVIYCGDNLDPRKKLPDGCVDLIYIDSQFNSTQLRVLWRDGRRLYHR
jgi:hypothetical protein